MIGNGRKLLIMSSVLVVLLSVSRAATAEQMPPLLPAGVVMQDTFKPGFGADVGLVQRTTERVALIHARDTVGYWARVNLPVFMKDSVITPVDGRAILQFADESTVAISSGTKLVINRTIFDPDKKERSSFLDITMGKARFWVKKLPGFTRSEFKIKTKTLVAGVRGSDLVIDDKHPDYTSMYAFDDTEIEFTGLADPTKTLTMNSFEKITAFAGEPISEENIEKLSPEEVEQLKSEMPLPESQEEKGTPAPVKMGQTKVVKGSTDQSTASEPGLASPTDTETGAPLLNVQQETVLLSGDELVDPIPPINIVTEPPLVPEFVEQTELTDIVQDAVSQQENINQNVAEDVINDTVTISPLPDMPGTPQ